jgi:hypothetical protein
VRELKADNTSLQRVNLKLHLQVQILLHEKQQWIGNSRGLQQQLLEGRLFQPATTMNANNHSSIPGGSIDSPPPPPPVESPAGNHFAHSSTPSGQLSAEGHGWLPPAFGGPLEILRFAAEVAKDSNASLVKVAEENKAIVSAVAQSNATAASAMAQSNAAIAQSNSQTAYAMAQSNATASSKLHLVNKNFSTLTENVMKQTFLPQQ